MLFVAAITIKPSGSVSSLTNLDSRSSRYYRDLTNDVCCHNNSNIQDKPKTFRWVLLKLMRLIIIIAGLNATTATYVQYIHMYMLDNYNYANSCCDASNSSWRRLHADNGKFIANVDCKTGKQLLEQQSNVYFSRVLMHTVTPTNILYIHTNINK